MVTRLLLLTQIVVWGKTTSGKTARMGRRTAEHLNYTIWRLSKVHPDAKLHVIQSAFNTGVAASAGTHDKDGCLDLWIEGINWWEAQQFLRQCGWAAWFRFPPAFVNHLHCISLGCPGVLGEYVDGGVSQFGHKTTSSQIDDYYHHALGLKGQHNSGADHSWFPKDINATIFDYDAWMKTKKELNMNHEQRARAALADVALPALVRSFNELKQVDKRKVKVRAQSVGLRTAILATRGVVAVLKK